MAEATSLRACIERHIAYPYDVWATEMSALQRGRLDAMYDLIPAGASALDIGCNSGYAALFRPDVTWHGVDVAPELVATAQARMSAQVASAEDLPFEDGSFDYAVMGEILEHVYDPAAVMAEAARVARMGIVGTTPHDAGAWGKQTVAGHRFHVRAFSEDELLALLSGFGTFTLIERLGGHFWLFEVAL